MRLQQTFVCSVIGHFSSIYPFDPLLSPYHGLCTLPLVFPLLFVLFVISVTILYKACFHSDCLCLQTIGCSEGATSQKVSVSIMDVRTCHCKARCPVYPGDGNVSRFAVPDENVAWNIVFPEYLPVEYTAPSVLKCPAWADSDYFTVGGHLGESAW